MVMNLLHYRRLGFDRWVGEWNGYPLQYFCLESPMDRGAWPVGIHGVSKSQTRLSDFHFHFFDITDFLFLFCWLSVITCQLLN